MKATRLVLGLSGAAFAGATNVFTADYNGFVTTFALTDVNGTYHLAQTAETTGCAPNPSWLTVDVDRGLLYCLNEGLTAPNGSVSSFAINADGSLQHVQNITTLSGPVSGILYGPPSGPRALALAHYTAGAVSSYLVDDRGHLTFNNLLAFHTPPGPNRDRQGSSHAHEVILDPTGQYLLVPDLGADRVHVLVWDPVTLRLAARPSLRTAPGAGPRHAAFWNPYGTACETCTTFLYLVAELAGTLTGYAVRYLPARAGLHFTEVTNGTTFGLLKQPAGTAPAEVHVAPDNQYLIISNRNDSSFTLPLANGTLLPSDSLSTFALRPDGSVTPHQLWPAGGAFPRHFSTNAVGSLVGVGEQSDHAVVLLRRDAATGLIGGPVARVPLTGQVTNVVFAEQKALGVLGG